MKQYFIIPDSFFQNLKLRINISSFDILEKTLNDILNTGGDPYKKILVYINVLERFLRNSQEQITSDDPEPTTDSHSDKTTQKTVDLKEAKLSKTLIDLENIVPKESLNKAVKLISDLWGSDKFTWLSDYTVIINGRKIENSNILDQVKTIVSNKKTDKTDSPDHKLMLGYIDKIYRGNKKTKKKSISKPVYPKTEKKSIEPKTEKRETQIGYRRSKRVLDKTSDIKQESKNAKRTLAWEELT